MMMTTQTLLLWAWLASASLMLVLWVIQLFRHNAGTVDVAWAFATASLGIGFAIGSDVGDPERRLLVAVLGGIWGLRLGIHLFRRVTAETEDSRYRYLRSSLGSKAQFVLFLFFQIQALWAVVFAAPMWAAARSPVLGLQWHDWIGGAIWIIAIVGESVADAQLSRFRRDPANAGKVCQSGLWRYSRHPNYFFEWVHWWAYVFIGIGSDWWWVTLAGALVMAVFLLKVTGIPHTEQQALRSRGEAYRRYMASTSAFVPLPPKTRQG